MLWQIGKQLVFRKLKTNFFFQATIAFILKEKNILLSPHYLTNFQNLFENVASVFLLGPSKMA